MLGINFTESALAIESEHAYFPAIWNTKLSISCELALIWSLCSLWCLCLGDLLGEGDFYKGGDMLQLTVSWFSHCAH